MDNSLGIYRLHSFVSTVRFQDILSDVCHDLLRERVGDAVDPVNTLTLSRSLFLKSNPTSEALLEVSSGSSLARRMIVGTETDLIPDIIPGKTFLWFNDVEHPVFQTQRKDCLKTSESIIETVVGSQERRLSIKKNTLDLDRVNKVLNVLSVGSQFTGKVDYLTVFVSTKHIIQSNLLTTQTVKGPTLWEGKGLKPVHIGTGSSGGEFTIVRHNLLSEFT
jgi:hypothetical protein